MVKYCLPIIRNTIEDINNLININSQYDMYEVWIDYCDDNALSEIKNIANKLKDKLILVSRRQDLGPRLLTPELRRQIFQEVANNGCYISLELSSEAEDIPFVANLKNNNLIIAYHNYEETPSDDFLKDLIQQMKDLNADICKISTYCQNESDALRLLNLKLELHRNNTRSIILGMGEHGVITRVFGSLWGNEIIFAPFDASTISDPGQLTFNELSTVINILK